jgi:hypothetical protein
LEDFIEKLSRDTLYVSKINNLNLENKRHMQCISTEKQNYINYLTAIKNAFSETDTNKLLSKWQEVDEIWMNIK